AGFCPMKMPGVAGQHDDASRRIGLHRIAVELLAEPDIKNAGDDRVDAIFGVLVRHQLGAAGHLDPDNIGSGLVGVTDHDRETGCRRKRGERLPVNLFRQDRAKHGLTRLMRTRHETSPLALTSGAADLKSLTHSRPYGVQGLRIESGTRIVNLLVPITFRSPR